MSETRVFHRVLGAAADLGLWIAAIFALLLVAAAVPALAATPEAAPTATAAPSSAAAAPVCGSDNWLLPSPVSRTEAAVVAGGGRIAPEPPASPIHLRYCRCGCGFRCSTDADCGPGGQCVVSPSCC